MPDHSPTEPETGKSASGGTGGDRDPISVADATFLLTVHTSDAQMERSLPLLVLGDESLHNLQQAAHNLGHINSARMLMAGIGIGALLANRVSLDTVLWALGDEDRPHSRGTLPMDLGSPENERQGGQRA